jgi:glutamine amidotransferase PdxT
MPNREPNLNRKLAHTIKPTGGPAAQLETLADAAQLIADLAQFRQARPYWDRCAEMLMVAARTGRKDDIAEATRSLEVALGKENWLKG